MQSALQQFIAAAERIAALAHYDVIRLGVVELIATRSILALSLRLENRATAPAPLEETTTSLFRAMQFQLPLNELNHVLAQLNHGRLAEVVVTRDEGAAPVVFQPPLRPHLETGQDWRYEVRGSDKSLTNTMLLRSGFEFRITLPEPWDDTLDAQVALESRYAYASLSRLIFAFTGLQMERGGVERPRSIIAGMAPWPVHHLTATIAGSLVTVTVNGLTGVDTSRFILNMESTPHDRRFDHSGLRWRPASATHPSQTTYSTQVDMDGWVPSAVNLFVANVKEISLRAEVVPATYILAESIAGTMTVSDASTHEAPQGARLTRLRVSGFKLLRAVELELTHPLAVIVGPNQSGKSSVLDALQLLSDAARGDLSDALVRRRSGLGSLLSRGGGTALSLEVELEATSFPTLRYQLTLSPAGAYDFTIPLEQLSVKDPDGTWQPFLMREGNQASIGGKNLTVQHPRESLISKMGVGSSIIEAVRQSLAAIAIYPYFRTGAAWADPEAVPMRRPARLEPGVRLDRTGDNLAAVLSSMRDERPEDWSEFLGMIRLAFPQLKDLRMPTVSRGTVQLFWDEVSGQSFDAAELSDGTLSFLATLCAMFQPGSALIAVDEPEQHLHPDALRRLVGAARSLSARQPILFATQSDALIGFLDETPEAIVVAHRGPQGTTLVRPDLPQLKEWVQSFSLRELRRELEGWGSDT